MATHRLGLIVGSLLVAVACDTSGSVQVAANRRIRELSATVSEHVAADEYDPAFEVIREMIAIDPDHPRPYFLVASLHRPRREYDKAEQLLRDMRPAGPGPTYGLAKLELYRRNSIKAEALFRETLERYREMDHFVGQASSLYSLGIALDRQERLDEAADAFVQARKFWARVKDPIGEASVVSNLAELEASRSGLDAARPLHDEVADLFARSGNRVVEGVHWDKVGTAYAKEGRYEEAREHYRRSVELLREAGARTDMWTGLRKLADVSFRSGHEEEANALWGEAIAVAEELGEPGRVVQILTDRGFCLHDAGRAREAVSPLEQAIALARERDHANDLVRPLYEFGAVQWTLGAYLQAEGTMNEVIALEGTNAWYEAKARTTLAAVLSTIGDLPGALEHQLRALELARQLKSRSREGTALNNLGHFYHVVGLGALSERYFREYVELAVEMKDPKGEAFARVNLGVVLRDLDRLDEARAEFDKALTLSGGIEDSATAASARLWIGLLLDRQGRRDEGLRQVDRAVEDLREIDDTAGVAKALIVRGSLLRARQEFDDALAALGEAARIASERGVLRLQWAATAGLGETYAEAGRPEQAMAEYRRALELIEVQRTRLMTDELKMHFLAREDSVYERAVSTQLRLETGAAPEAFWLVEQARARSLGELLVEARATLRTGLPAELAAREQAAIEEVSAAARRLAEARNEEAKNRARRDLEAAEQRLRRFKLEARREAPLYFDVVYPEPSRLSEIQSRVLAADEVMLRYYIGRTRAMVWIVDRDQARFHELPDPDEIASLVSDFLDCCGRAGVSRDGIAEAEALTRALLPESLPAKRKLIVVPDGPLYHLPIDILRRGGKFLAEDYEIQVVPSATTLALLRTHETAPAREGFLGVGNPVLPDDDDRFPSLPHSARALRGIAELFPEGSRLVLEGPAATKEALLEQSLERYRFVHFATHGLLDRDNPKYYGLRLSPSADGDGGYLFFNDVFGMRLGAELVVLSACRSGAGEQLRGEGLVGMARAFLYAGARSILVSLWNVNDKSTAEFMQEFYSEIARGRTVADALRRTKLAFIRSDRPARRQPYRWAPFVLVGDPGTAPSRVARR